MGTIAKKSAGKELRKAEPQKGIQKLLSDNWDRIQSVMPKHMNPERLYQLSVSAINQTPKLAECTPSSLLSCVMKCSALGLEPSAVDGLGRAYILPFYNKGHMEATFILGYKGMIDLARNSGQILTIEAHPVYKGDEFDYRFGLNSDLTHVPHESCEKTPDNLTHVYAIARFKDGGYQFDVMTKAEVDNIRKHSKAGKNGPWVDWYEAMALKTVVRKASKLWPMSVAAREAVAADETTGGFEDIIDHSPVIETEAIEEEPETPSEEVQETLVEAPETDSKTLRRAVCRSCGHLFDIAADATAEDLKTLTCECGSSDLVFE